ncbi:hypothetical protein EDC01DRAFT_780432 [Geopyxis carbonaria]|nr:hypothetical protein EDC01DRAFT_780432 [Geopyxis carbonaria]
MASFLRRSKSTVTRDRPNRDRELPFTSRDLLSMSTRRARGPTPSTPHTTTNTPATIPAPFTTTTVTTGTATTTRPNLLKLARRKSISSTRESKMALGIPETWEPPVTSTTTITAAERKRRTSMFFGLASPPVHAPPPPPQQKTSPPPRRAAPPPPIKLSAFPPRASSRGGPSPDVGSEVGVALGDEAHIGMALGSPSESSMLAGSSTNSTYLSLSTVASDPKSPAFVLPSTPFGVPPPPRTATATATSTPRRLPEFDSPEPKTAGWRKRIFGKGLFSKRPPVPQRAEPPPEKLEYRRSPVPHVAKKARAATPCLDVHIPSVEMERYSVMFDTLLHPSDNSELYRRRRSRDLAALTLAVPTSPAAPAAAAAPPRSPLRRNATTGSHISPRSPLSRLGDDLRRISSDSRSRSPSPAPMLARSHTSPATHLSPPQLSPPPPLPFTGPATPTTAHRPATPPSPATPRSSFDTGDDTWLPHETEPAWEMVTPERGAVAVKERRDARDVGKEVEIAVAAQISIARQISVSQRQVLVPLGLDEGKANRMGAMGGKGMGGMGAMGGMGGVEGMGVGMRPMGMRPRLVQHRGSCAGRKGSVVGVPERVERAGEAV